MIVVIMSIQQIRIFLQEKIQLNQFYHHLTMLSMYSISQQRPLLIE
jgi:hypothetical protein